MTFERMPWLGQPDRDRAIGTLEAGRTTRQAAKAENVHHSVIVHLHQHYLARGTKPDRPRPGSPCVTTRADISTTWTSEMDPFTFDSPPHPFLLFNDGSEGF